MDKSAAATLMAMAGKTDQVGPVAFLFETCVVGSRPDGRLAIALIDHDEPGQVRAMVAECSRETAEALCAAIKDALGSATNDALKQGDDDEADT